MQKYKCLSTIPELPDCSSFFLLSYMMACLHSIMFTGAVIFDTQNQAQFYKYLLQGDVVKIEQLLSENLVDINFIYDHRKKRELNALQIICTQIIEKRESEDYTDKLRTDYIDCIKILLQYDIDLTYKDPDFNAQTVDYSVLTGDKELVEIVLQKYEEKEISIVNMDLISNILNYHANEPCVSLLFQHNLF